MMKIGFNNFRRFIHFEPLEFRGITFLVGRNNAGKSTLVKALLLLDDFFKSEKNSEFSFSNNVLENANVVTYGRAKNINAKNDFITFEFQFFNYHVEITVSGHKDKTVADVHNLLIIDKSNNFNFHFQPIISTLTIFQGNVLDIDVEMGINENIKLVAKEINDLESTIKSSKLKKTSREYIDLLGELERLRKKQEILQKEETQFKENLFYFTTTFDKEKTLLEIVESSINQAIVLHNLEFSKIQGGDLPSMQFKDYRAIKEEESKIRESFTDFYFSLVKDSTIIYLGANSMKQSALFTIRDRSNPLAQAVHEFFQLKINPGEPAYEFVRKWMKIYEVGDDFEIILHAGEAYEVTIFSNDVKIHLADKGMGSIQAMLLILRLSTIIYKWGDSDQIVTVIIEEPELNLHPALQSKLADLFLDVHQRFNIDFLIETHSEYILRRSQVIVAENEFEVAPNENPFCVHYFPKDFDQLPYQLKYQADGTFDKNFGTGFFDTASLDTLKLLRIKREKKA